MNNKDAITVHNVQPIDGMIVVRSKKTNQVTAIRPTSKKAFVDAFMAKNPDQKRSHVEKVVFRTYLNQLIEKQSEAARDAISSGKIRINSYKFNKDGVLTALAVEKPEITSAAQAAQAVERLSNADAKELTPEDIAALEKKLAEARAAQAEAKANKNAGTADVTQTSEAEVASKAAQEIPVPANA